MAEHTHVYLLVESDWDCSLVHGAYSTRQLAESSLLALAKRKGFHGPGMQIEKVPVDPADPGFSNAQIVATFWDIQSDGEAS